jgi:hypothetical protein
MTQCSQIGSLRDWPQIRELHVDLSFFAIASLFEKEGTTRECPLFFFHGKQSQVNPP